MRRRPIPPARRAARRTRIKSSAMTTLLLVRHASHALNGRVLVGRMPGVHLDARGRDEAARLESRLAARPIARVVSSPRERAIETAHAIARTHALQVQPEPAFDELAFGAWTGRPFATLADDAWRRFNTWRSAARPPGGESMREAQTRAVCGIERLCAEVPEGTVVVVSHLDLLRALLAH